MAALPRNALLLVASGAALLCGAVTLAHAQEARPNRISPVDPRLVSPPPMRMLGRPAEPPARPVTMAEFVDGARLCMGAVSLQFDVHPRILTDAGWSFMRPREI